MFAAFMNISQITLVRVINKQKKGVIFTNFIPISSFREHVDKKNRKKQDNSNQSQREKFKRFCFLKFNYITGELDSPPAGTPPLTRLSSLE